MGNRQYDIAVVGATGLVGAELLEALQARRFPAGAVKLFASWNTAGERMPFRDDEIQVKAISADFFQGMEIVFFASHPMVSRDLAEQAAGGGALVIDASNFFRLEPEVPLVVPEVNPEALAGIRGGGRIIASPSPAAIALALVIAPLQRRFEVRRLVATAAFGSTAGGRAAFEEHQQQTIDIFNQNELRMEKFGRQSAFNIFPRVGDFIGGEAAAERELITELPKILGYDLPVAVTAMQAPVFCGLGISASLDLGREARPEEVREELAAATGVMVMDDPDQGVFPDTLQAMAHEEILVGRIRMDPSRNTSLLLWISADNLRKGAAVNMVQIAEAAVANWP